MVDIDISHRPPLRLGVVQDDDVHWYRDVAAQRVGGTDLGDVARRSARVRSAQPGSEVAADIDVVIASDAATARGLIDSHGSERHRSAILTSELRPALPG